MEKLLQKTVPSTVNSKNAVARTTTSNFKQPVVLVTIAAAIIGTGLYLNWPAVVALGIAPLILTFAPCALMCALRFCAMSGMKIERTPTARVDHE